MRFPFLFAQHDVIQLLGAHTEKNNRTNMLNTLHCPRSANLRAN